MIQGLQYFTQAYVAATVAGGSASQAGDAEQPRARLPARTRRSSIPVLLYYHGFRFFNMGYAVGDGDAAARVSFAVTLVILRNSRRWVHYAGARP